MAALSMRMSGKYSLLGAMIPRRTESIVASESSCSGTAGPLVTAMENLTWLLVHARALLKPGVLFNPHSASSLPYWDKQKAAKAYTMSGVLGSP